VVDGSSLILCPNRILSLRAEGVVGEVEWLFKEEGSSEYVKSTGMCISGFDESSLVCNPWKHQKKVGQIEVRAGDIVRRFEIGWDEQLCSQGTYCLPTLSKDKFATDIPNWKPETVECTNTSLILSHLDLNTYPLLFLFPRDIIFYKGFRPYQSKLQQTKYLVASGLGALQPPTYLLESAEDCALFLQDAVQNHPVWVLKQGSLEGGAGVSIMKSEELVDLISEEPTRCYEKYTNGTYLVQSYIMNPVLVNK